jgi:hypothetical protein
MSPAGSGRRVGGSRVLTAHQPNYLPWLGLFHRVAQADVWVLADDVQFSKHGYTNRVRVRTAGGWQWLTVPVRTRRKGGQQIRQVETIGSNWQSKHWRTLEWNYRSSAHFDDFAPFLASFYAETRWRHLVDVNVALCDFLRGQLGIEVEARLSSSMELRRERSERLADMALACGCDVYLAGAGGSRRYLEESCFAEAGVELRFVDFEHPEYRQCFPGFEANLTALDLLFNCGAEYARRVLESARN